MTTPTTEKPLTDWNAWLGDVPPEKRHVGCQWCTAGKTLTPGRKHRAKCGATFIARGGKATLSPSPEYCDHCAALWMARCSPSCQGKP